MEILKKYTIVLTARCKDHINISFQIPNLRQNLIMKMVNYKDFTQNSGKMDVLHLNINLKTGNDTAFKNNFII